MSLFGRVFDKWKTICFGTFCFLNWAKQNFVPIFQHFVPMHLSPWLSELKCKILNSQMEFSNFQKVFLVWLIFIDFIYLE